MSKEGDKAVGDVKKRKERKCCACKKIRKIVNIGGPPLCADCFPLACNWSKAIDEHQKFMMSLVGITPLEIDIGRNDDLNYFLDEISKYLAEAKMRLKQAEICLINICTMLRNENQKKSHGKQLKLAEIPPTRQKWKRVEDKSDWQPVGSET